MGRNTQKGKERKRKEEKEKTETVAEVRDLED